MARQSRNRIKEATAYFRATEEVSKPIAFLMLFFSLAFIASVTIGVFLLGRWGYRKIVKVDQPVVVTTQDNTSKTTDTVVPSDSNVNNTPPASTIPAPTQSNNTVKTTALPNTGQSLEVYVVIAIIGAVMHQIYLRSKLRE